MEIQLTNSFSQDVRALAKAENKKEIGPIGPQVAELAHAKNAAKAELRLGTETIDSDVTVSAGDNPQALVLKTVIEGINEALTETLGENAIQNTLDPIQEINPEATAEQLVSLSTAAFNAYQEANPNVSQADALSTFIETIRTGIEQGFTEARNILASLNVLKMRLPLTLTQSIT